MTALLLAVAAALLSGCMTLSASLRHDDIRSVWGPNSNGGRALPPRIVFYATDRAPDDPHSDGKGFSQNWGGVARCGRAVTRIANAVSPVAPDPTLEPLPCEGPAQMAAFARAVAADAGTRHCDRVLLIVHGFNLTFRNGLLHGAQIATDTQYPCATLLLNWSSEGLFNRYAADIERSGYAVPLLIDLVRALNDAGLKPDLMGHSMGARISLSAMAALCPEPAPIVNELILIAPDVSAEPGNDDFGRLLARDARCARRATIYASDNDLALMASESIHGGVPRAGQRPLQALDYAAASPNVDAVDASLGPGDPSGHAYFVFAYEALDDLMWVLDGASLADRAAKGTLDCMAQGAGGCARYGLKVAKARQPSPSRMLLRAIWPAILPFQ
jgi:esterase/lipase superfamily enzyme